MFRSAVIVSAMCLVALLWTATERSANAAAPARTSAAASQPAALDLFEARTFTGKDDKKLPYRLLMPVNYDKSKKYPLVLFLHGSGECGTDNAKQICNGVEVFASADKRAKYPCFVVAPQCPNDDMFVHLDWKLGLKTLVKMQPEPAVSLALTQELVAALQKEFSIDLARLYITGISLGGYSTWEVLSRWPGMYAAAAPVCGAADLTTVDTIIKAKTPIWAFHGGADGTVNPDLDRQSIAALKKAGGEPKYTEYPGVGHNSWTKAYADEELYTWMFNQKKN
jgi:predicted peptidase